MLTLQGKLVLALAGAIIICVMMIAYQRDRITRYQEKISKLETDVATLIRGIALTESLRKANGDLDRFQAEIREDLVDVPDYDDPLSDDIIGIHERLRSGSQRPVGPVR